MNKILINIVEHNCAENMFDFDTETQTVSKVLRLFGENNTVRFSRFDYAYSPQGFREATEKDYDNFDITCAYYLEDGSRPYKKRDCADCNEEGCSHNQKYYNQ